MSRDVLQLALGMTLAVLAVLVASYLVWAAYTGRQQLTTIEHTQNELLRELAVVCAATHAPCCTVVHITCGRR
jgi:hypothetical protein